MVAYPRLRYAGMSGPRLTPLRDNTDFVGKFIEAQSSGLSVREEICDKAS